MNSLQVKYFLTLCSERSFSKAASKLFVTQPSFSQFIKKIESEVGTELIDRSCSPIKLTEAGEAYHNACVQFAAIEEDMNNAISSLSELKSGRLSVGTESFRASTMLAKSIAAFKKEFPGVDIYVTEGSQKFLESGVASGDIDLAICSGEFDMNMFHSEVLADENLYMAVPKDDPVNMELTEYKLEHNEITGNSLKILKTPRCSIEMFSKLPYIELRQGEGISDNSKEIFRQAGVKPNTIVSARNLFTAVSFVLEGMGITIIPDTMIRYGNMLTHPYYYALDSVYAVNKVCLVTRRNKYMSRTAVEYCRILKQLIRSGTWRV